MAVVALTAILAACGNGEVAGTVDGPHDEAAEQRPDLMVADPDPARPGDDVELRFPEGTDRGIGFVLEQLDGDDIVLHAYLTSAPTDAGPDEPSWIPATDGEPGWEAIGISGEGADVVELPDDLDAGDYRICTAISAPNICTSIAVTAD